MRDVANRHKRAGRYDELRDADGAVRPAWKPLSDSLAAMGAEEFARRDIAAQAMLRDNGVTYNVYDEAGGQDRRWQLDIMPFIVSKRIGRVSKPASSSVPSWPTPFSTTSTVPKS